MNIKDQTIITNSTLTNVAVNVDQISNSIIGNISNSPEPKIREMSEAVGRLVKALTDDGGTLDKDFKHEVLNQLNEFAGVKDDSQRRSLGKRLLLSLNGLLQLGGNVGTIALAVDHFLPLLRSFLG